MTRARRLCVCLGLLASVARCATSPSTRSTHPLKVRYTVAGDAAAFYRTEPLEGDAVSGPEAARVSRGITRAAEQNGHALIPDARLGELAAWVAGVIDPRGSPPANDAIDLMAHHLGLVEPAPHLLVLAQNDAAQLEDHVTEELARLLPQQSYTHYGGASVERDGGVLAVVVLSWRWLTLAPIPRAVELGASVRLEGHLLDGVSGAQLVVVYPDGSSERSDPQKGDAIALPLVTRGRGEHRVELLGNSARGETVVANFPLYVGIPPVTEITVASDSEDGRASESEAVARLLELINADRKRAGLAQLAAHDALAVVARAHSEDMRAHGFVGHTSPTTGNPEDRVRAAGIRTQVVLENIGRGYGPEEVHRGLMDSPGHRENVLNPLATHVGIGVVLEREDQRVAFLVTELFARFAPKIDVGAAPASLLDKINAARAQRGDKALVTDRTLTGLCAATASEVFTTAAKSRQQLVEQLNQKAARSRLPYTRISAVLTLVSSLDEAAATSAVLEPRARAIGVAVVQGSRSDTIDNAIAVAILLGY